MIKIKQQESVWKTKFSEIFCHAGRGKKAAAVSDIKAEAVEITDASAAEPKAEAPKKNAAKKKKSDKD